VFVSHRHVRFSKCRCPNGTVNTRAPQSPDPNEATRGSFSSGHAGHLITRCAACLKVGFRLRRQQNGQNETSLRRRDGERTRRRADINRCAGSFARVRSRFAVGRSTCASASRGWKGENKCESIGSLIIRRPLKEAWEARAGQLMGTKPKILPPPLKGAQPPPRLDHSTHKALAGATREIRERAVKIQSARMKLHSRSRDKAETRFRPHLAGDGLPVRPCGTMNRSNDPNYLNDPGSYARRINREIARSRSTTLRHDHT